MNLKLKVSIVVEFYKKNGMKTTIKKILTKIKKIVFSSFKQHKFEKEENENYKLWIQNNEPNEEELEKQRNTKFEYEPKISIIVPMYNTKEKYLKELIDSVVNQTYTNWELCLADGSNEKREYIEPLVNLDKRIKYKFLNANKGISENSNEALKLATRRLYGIT